ncbi:MAG: hypothetical protein ACJATA_000015 [Sphingobacteriales bacterium]|jgi:hypothetical protein
MKPHISILFLLFIVGFSGCKYDSLDIIEPEVRLIERFRLQPREAGFKFPNRVEIVAQVVNGLGQGKAGLTKKDFLVKDDFQNIWGEGDFQVNSINASEIKTSLVILMDKSGEDPSHLKMIKESSKEFINSLEPEINVAIFSVGADVSLEISFTKDKLSLLSALDAVSHENGPTNLVSGMNIAEDSLNNFNDIRYSSGSMVVFTDGFEDEPMDLRWWDYNHRHIICLGGLNKEEAVDVISGGNYQTLKSEQSLTDMLLAIGKSVNTLRFSFYKIEYIPTEKSKYYKLVEVSLIGDKLNYFVPTFRGYYFNYLMFSPDEYDFQKAVPSIYLGSYGDYNHTIFREKLNVGEKELYLAATFDNGPKNLKYFFSNIEPEFWNSKYESYVNSNTGNPHPGVELLNVNSDNWMFEGVTPFYYTRETFSIGVKSVNYDYSEVIKKKYLIVFIENGSTWNYFDSGVINE